MSMALSMPYVHVYTYVSAYAYVHAYAYTYAYVYAYVYLYVYVHIYMHVFVLPQTGRPQWHRQLRHLQFQRRLTNQLIRQPSHLPPLLLRPPITQHKPRISLKPPSSS